MADETVFNLFVSSPGDVQRERERVDFVVERLNADYAGRVRIRTVRWETRYYSSHDTFQAQILEAAACDLVLAIFGARLGSPLPDGFRTMPSGEPYPSGTAYEVLTAMEARRQGRGIPDIFVFRRPAAPLIALDASDRADVEAQWRRLGDFFETWFRNRSGQFLAAFQEFDSTDAFAAKVEDCLVQWLDRHGFPPRASAWDRRRQGSPYPGLSAFDADRRNVFFGREVAVDQALRRLRELEAGEGAEGGAEHLPFLLLIGASGSGKSSLLRAGLLPRVGSPGVLPEVDAWCRAVVVPGEDPFVSLAETLLDGEVLGDELAATPFGGVDLLARQLAGDPRIAVAPVAAALAAVAEARRRTAGRETIRPARLFLVIDQAERLLVEVASERRERFAALLATLCRRRLATVVMALRSDAYPLFQGLDDLVELRSRGATLDLLPATASELEEMVTRPAAACDPPLSFERRDGRSLAAVLVAEARGGDALPLLQMTLARLAAAEAERGDGVLRFDDHLGLGVAVGRSADEALDGLSAAARAQLPDLIAGLVRDFSTDPATGRPLPLIGALDRARFEADRPERRALVDTFVAHRLLVSEGDSRGRRVRPTHESLLRIWPEAVAILEEVSHLVRARAAIEPMAREWAEAADADRARHLEVSPALLDGALAWSERFGDEAPREFRDFVTAAAALAEERRTRERRDQERRLADAEAIARANRRIARTTGVGLAAALVLAGLAGWQWRTAVVAREEAQVQRDRAERSLAAAAATADGLVFDLAQKFRNITGVPKPVIGDILDRARRLQEQLFALGSVDPKLEGGRAAALGEAAATVLSLGDAAQALDLATRTRDIYARLAAADPGDFRWLFDRAHAENQIGAILWRQGRVAEADAAHRRAQEIAEAGIAGGVVDFRLRQLRASILADRGTLARDRGDGVAALDLHRLGLEVTRALVAEQPNDMALQHNLAVALRSVGDAELDAGAIDEAERHFAASAEVAARLARDHPDNTLLLRDHTLGQERHGLALVKKGDFAGALRAFEEGEATALTLSAGDPANLEWRYDVAIGHLEIGDAHRALGDLAAAARSYGAAREIDAALVATDPAADLWRRHLDDALRRLSEVAAQRGDRAAAVAFARERVASAEAAIARDVATVEWRRRAAETELGLGVLLHDADRTEEAIAAFRRGLEQARGLGEGRGDRRALVTALGQAGRILVLADRPGEAVAYFAEGAAVAHRLLGEDPRDGWVRGDLALLLISSAAAHGFLGERRPAIADLREAIDLARGLAAETSGDARWRRETATALDRLGDALDADGDAAGAIAAYRGSLAEIEALPEGERTSDAVVAAATATREALAMLLVEGEPAAALAALRGALEVRRAATARNGDDLRGRRLLVADLGLAAGLLESTGAAEEARATRREAVAVARETVAKSAGEAATRHELAVALIGLGTEARRTREEAMAAAAVLDEAWRIATDLSGAAPRDVGLLRLAGLAGRSLGTARLAAGDRDGALVALVAARDADASAASASAESSDAANLKQDVARIGLVADAMVTAGDPDAALAALERATPRAADQQWLDLVRAAALLVADRSEEARRVLDRHRGERLADGRRWEDAVVGTMARLRGQGIASPTVAEIEAAFGGGR